MNFVAALMRLIPAVVIREDDCERFCGLNIGYEGCVKTVPSYRKLFLASFASDDAPHDVFWSVNFKLAQLYRYWAER